MWTGAIGKLASANPVSASAEPAGCRNERRSTMSKYWYVLTVGIGLAVGLVPGQAGLQGTPHDLSNKGWGTTELCKFCHTPHAAQNVTGAPLWNHQTSSQTYTLYSSPTFKGAVSQTQPGPQSKLCLSCHDGTVAIDSYANGGVLQTGTHFMTSTNLIGANGSLASDHPIAFTYNPELALAQKHLATPVSESWVDGGQTLPLYKSKMECATCHSVHDNSNNKFLRVSNAGSAMCMSCHTL